MRKSRLETALTRGRIVSTAAKMFLERGLNGVGMRDMIAVARLPQGGFFRHFASKEELIAEPNGTAFDRLYDMLAKETEGIYWVQRLGTDGVRTGRSPVIKQLWGSFPPSSGI